MGEGRGGGRGTWGRGLLGPEHEKMLQQRSELSTAVNLTAEEATVQGAWERADLTPQGSSDSPRGMAGPNSPKGNTPLPMIPSRGVPGP